MIVAPDERRRGAPGRAGGAGGMSAGALRVAMLTYSVQPARRGRARDRGGRGARGPRPRRSSCSRSARPATAFFRAPAVPATVVRHMSRPSGDVRRDDRLDDRDLPRRPAPVLRDGGFDVVHAQDCLSANAALALRDEGVIDARDPHRPPRRRLHARRRSSSARIRSIARARPRAVRLAAVGRARSATSSASRPGLVGNGVDTDRFRPPRDAGRARAPTARRAGLDERLAVLTVGGIEPRKGSLTLLEAFAALRERVPDRRPAARDRRRRDAVRLPRRARALRTTRAAALGLDGARARARPGRGRRSSRRCSAPPTCSPSRRSRRASGWRRSRRWPRASPPSSLRPRRVPRLPRRRRQRAARARRRRRRAGRRARARGARRGAAPSACAAAAATSPPATPGRAWPRRTSAVYRDFLRGR